MNGRSQHGISATGADETTLGDHVLGQLLRLGAVVGLDDADAALYGQILLDSLSATARRPLSLPPASPSFISDDHTPVEFSLACTPGAPPVLRVLAEPGFAAENMAESARAGLAAVREMAGRWDFSTDQLDALQDLFFPASAGGPLALWYALELRPGGVPGVKIYLNPNAAGPEHAARTVREALRRLGYGQAFSALPGAAGYPFFALDLGTWESPRAKVYLSHPPLSADDACVLSGTTSGSERAGINGFFSAAAGSVLPSGPDTGNVSRPIRRPVLTCHAFSDRKAGPSGFTLHIPVRDYVRDDGEALGRATALLTRFGMDASVLSPALRAVTRRQLADGVGLIAYLALAYERNRRPRITAYLSCEAYAVRPPSSHPWQDELTVT